MITIKNLNIKFDDKVIIDNGKFVIPNGKLCLIASESGTGKSLLFDVLSLNNTEHPLEYTLNGLDISNLQEKEKLALKENHISYVPQNALLINKLSVIDQLNLFNKNNRLSELLEVLDIKDLIHKKIKHLSGGERQRVSIACALLKNADFYLFDEPTAMLDEENKIAVTKLIEGLAQNNKMVFVATHEKDYFHDYIEYQIVDKKIQSENHFYNDTTPLEFLPTQKDKLKNRLSIKYFLNSPFLNALTILITSICISLMVGITSFCFYNDSQLDLTFNTIYESELYIVNPFFENDSNFSSDQLAIDSSSIKAIEKIEHVKAIYPYIPSGSCFGNGFITDECKIEYKRIEEIDEMILKKDGKVINTIDYKMAFMEWVEINGEKIPFYPQNYYIGVSYPHQQFDQKCDKVIEGDGFYITLEFANKLQLNEISGETLTIQMTVPIATSGIVLSYTDEKTGEWINQKSNMHTDALLTVELPIKGILTNPIYGNYLGGEDVHIFLNYETLLQLQSDAHQKHYSHITQLMKTPQSDATLREFYDYELISDSWESSAYIIQVDHFDNVKNVIEEIKRINPNLVVNITTLQYGKTGAILDDEVLNSYKVSGIIYPLLICIASIIGIVIIHYFILKRRNKDNQFLKMNGLSNYDIQDIYFREAIIEGLLSLPIASFFTHTFVNYISSSANINLAFSHETFVILAMLDGLFITLVYNISSMLIKRE